MKNKLTLKQLKQELDSLKSKKAQSKGTTETHKASVAHDIKNSYIQNLHMKSSMFYFWIISWIIYFANKFPFISKIATILSLYYGKTTWWRILVKIRKLFVIFNAAIGMYMVYKTTGFGVDTFWANFVAIGNSYLDIFLNFNRRVFNWLVELFDYKLIPGGDTPKPKFNGGETSWNILEALNKKGSSYSLLSDDSKEFFSLRELYKHGKIEVKPWYSDYGWFYYLLGTALIIGGLYAGYKFLVDPLFVESFPANNNPTTQVTLPSPEGSITPPAGTSGTKSLVMFLTTQVKKLNPTYWFWSAEDVNIQRKVFLYNQGTDKYNNNFYPYTANNPYDSWFKKLRIHYFGETVGEALKREHDRDIALLKLVPSYIRVQDQNPLPFSPIIPSIGSVGLGNDVLASTWTSESALSERFKSLPSTPKFLPTLPDFDGGVTSWKDHVSSGTPTDARELIKSIKGKEVIRSLSSENSFAVLEVE